MGWWISKYKQEADEIFGKKKLPKTTPVKKEPSDKWKPDISFDRYFKERKEPFKHKRPVPFIDYID